MTQEKRYLPLFDEDGTWALQRPDIYVLIRMSVRDDQGGGVVEQTYKYMAESSDNTRTRLNEVEAVLERKYIRGHMTDRRYAAMVLMQLVRLSLNNQEPTLGNALKLVAPTLREENPQTKEESLLDRAKSAFSKWRSTCHLQAAFRAQIGDAETFEADHERFHNFLAKAKALEMFMDDTCARGRLKWNPWRVPEQIAPVFSGQTTRLSVRERALITVPAWQP